MWSYCANIVPNSGYKRLKNWLNKNCYCGFGSLKKLRIFQFCAASCAAIWYQENTRREKENEKSERNENFSWNEIINIYTFCLTSNHNHCKSTSLAVSNYEYDCFILQLSHKEWKRAIRGGKGEKESGAEESSLWEQFGRLIKFYAEREGEFTTMTHSIKTQLHCGLYCKIKFMLTNTKLNTNSNHTQPIDNCFLCHFLQSSYANFY